MAPTLASLMILADGRLPVGGHVHSGGVEAAMRDGRVTDLDDLEPFVLGRLYTSGAADAAMAAATVTVCTEPLEPNPAEPNPAEPVPGKPVPADSRLTQPRAGLTDEQIRERLRTLDAETNARLPAEPLRRASRRQGRQLTRLARTCWQHRLIDQLDGLHPDGPHQAIALGAVGAVCGLSEREAAALALHHQVTTPINAAVKLAGLDPFGAAALTVRLADHVEVLADKTVAALNALRRDADLADLADLAEDGRFLLADLPCDSAPMIEIAAVHHDARPDRLFAT